METLKPQFTPGQSMATAPPASIEEKLNNLQYQQELENRNLQIKDLSEKLETLKIKRQEDKERMKDYDKLKIQVFLSTFISSCAILHAIFTISARPIAGI